MPETPGVHAWHTERPPAIVWLPNRYPLTNHSQARAGLEALSAGRLAADLERLCLPFVAAKSASLGPIERRRLRGERCPPILAMLRSFLDDWSVTAVPKGAPGLRRRSHRGSARSDCGFRKTR